MVKILFFLVLTELPITKTIIIFFDDSLVFDIDNNRTCQNIAEVPEELYNVQGAFSGLSPIGTPLICGGIISEYHTTTCFELTISKKWVKYNHHFNGQRAYGASARFDGMLVAAIGGTDCINVEVLTMDGWQTTRYPGGYYDLVGACAVAVDSSMILIIVRNGNTKFFDINTKEFDDGPELLSPREDSACGFHKKTNCVLVVGGIDVSNTEMPFSEALCMSNEPLKWQRGPGFPQGQNIFENVLTIADGYFKI